MLLSASALWVLVGALVVDALIGDPAWLWRRVPHPVALARRAGRWPGRALNRATWSERRGDAARACSRCCCWSQSRASDRLARSRRVCAASLTARSGSRIVASVFLAQRSLYEHVGAVARGASRPVASRQARRAVSHDRRARSGEPRRSRRRRAAIESCAENFSDGVVAPGVLVRAARPAGPDRLQGGQHRRLDDRPPHRRATRRSAGRRRASTIS